MKDEIHSALISAVLLPSCSIESWGKQSVYYSGGASTTKADSEPKAATSWRHAQSV